MVQSVSSAILYLVGGILGCNYLIIKIGERVGQEMNGRELPVIFNLGQFKVKQRSIFHLRAILYLVKVFSFSSTRSLSGLHSGRDSSGKPGARNE